MKVVRRRSWALPTPEGREASLALRLKPFEKGFKNSKTFIEEDKSVQPRACEQRAPSVVLVHESFALYPCLGCDITLHGKVSPTDGRIALARI